MKAVYNNKNYEAEFKIMTTDVILYSYTKDEGFHNHTDPWGNEASDFFSKIVPQELITYIWENSYELKYQGRWFHLFTALNPQTIFEDYYEVILSFLDVEEKKLAEELDFERTDKFYYTKRIYRKDIKALKVIESPQGIFSSQGKKVRILEGEAIDAYLSELVRNDGVK